MADTAARLAIPARRNEVARFTIVVTGIDMTGIDMAMQIRLGRDVPGAPLISLATVTTLAAEGLKLDSVTTTNGVPTSIIKGRINASTMTDASKVPYMGEIGADSVLAYAMQWTLNGDAQTRLYGDFIVVGSAFGSDGAPTNRPPSYGASQSFAVGSTGGSLSFGDQIVSVTLAGAELLSPLVAKTELATAAAQQSAASSQASALSADASRDQAASLVLPQNIFATGTLAAAEGSVATGITFKWVHDGIADVRKRTSGGSTLLYQEATIAALASPAPGLGTGLLNDTPFGDGAITRPLYARLREMAVTPEDFNAVGGGAGDLTALQKALIAASQYKIPLVVRNDHYVNTTVNGALRYYSSLRMEFKGGSLRWDRGDLPLMYGDDVADVDLFNPKFLFSGTIPAGPNTADGNTFYNRFGRLPGDHFGANTLGCAFGMFGGDRVRLHDAEFRATDFSGPTKLMPFGACFFSRKGAVLSQDCGMFGKTVFDGVLMGLLGAGQSGFEVGNVRSRRYGALDPAVYPNFPPPHPIYFSGQTAPVIVNKDLTFGDLYDESIPVPGTNTTVPVSSWKFISVDGIKTGEMRGKRAKGLMEFGGDNFNFGRLVWDPSTAAAVSGYVAQFNTSCKKGGFSDGGYFSLPADFPTTGAGVFGFQQGAVKTEKLDFGTMVIEQAGTAILNALTGTLQDCTGHFVYRAPAMAAAQNLITLTNGGSNNCFTADIDVPDIGVAPAAVTLGIDSIRLRESDPVASTNNTAVLNCIRTGSVVTLTQGQKHGTYRIKKLVELANGAASGDAMTIPGGATLRSATALTIAADGGGSTGWQFGTPATVTRFGIRENWTVNSGTSDASWASATLGFFRQSAAVTLRVTPTGASSNGTGKVLTNVLYDFAAPNADTSA
jgi:hypothetical protein